MIIGTIMAVFMLVVARHYKIAIYPKCALKPTNLTYKVE